ARSTARVALRSGPARESARHRATRAAPPGRHAAHAASGQAPLESLASALEPVPQILGLLTTTLRDEPAAMLREGGVIRDGFDPELDDLRAVQDDCGSFLMAME